MYGRMYGSVCPSQTVRDKIREGERRKKETRLSQTFTAKGWTDLFLAGPAWLHLICFGPANLDLLMRRLCVADLAVSCSRPLGSVVACAWMSPEIQKTDMMLCRISETLFRESPKGPSLRGFLSKASHHFNCQITLLRTRPHLHGG